MYNGVQNLGFFSIHLDVTRLIFLSHASKKSRINVLYKMFSMIRIDKQNLNHKFWVFILILSFPWGQLGRKCTCHNFFPGTFFICFCGNTDVALDGHNGSDGSILTTWIVSPCEVVKLKLMRLTILVFVFHQSGLSSFTSILTLQPETRQILLVRNLFQI